MNLLQKLDSILVYIQIFIDNMIMLLYKSYNFDTKIWHV